MAVAVCSFVAVFVCWLVVVECTVAELREGFEIPNWVEY